MTDAAPAGRVRWVVCALLFAATTINYVDRQVLGILAPDLQRSLHWSEVQYGYIVTAFQAAYALGLLLVGRLMDRFGSRLGYALAVAFWSVAAMAHALARGALGFGVARAALGLGEAGNFPVAIKTVAEWFPKRDRAFATGLLNSGTNVGAIVAPLVVPPLALAFGWQWAFVATGALGLVWLAFWLRAYHPPASHPRVSPAELAYIHRDPADAEGGGEIRWAQLPEILIQSAVVTAAVCFLLGVAAVVAWILAVQQVPAPVTQVDDPRCQALGMQHQSHAVDRRHQ